MHSLSSSEFIALVAGRRGHFRMESSHHSGLWLDLDALFADTRRVSPFVSALTNALRPHEVDMVCGPLLGGAFLAQLVAQALEVEFCFTERHAPRDDSGMFTVQYRLPAAFRKRVAGRRIAMVDDVMSAGSALRGTYAELRSYGAVPVAAGALLVLGSIGADYFMQQGVPVEAVARDRFDTWLPANCPMCAEDVPLETVTA